MAKDMQIDNAAFRSNQQNDPDEPSGCVRFIEGPERVLSD